MKKTLLFIILLIFALPLTILGQTLLITEVVDGTASATPRYVEISNPTDATINLNGLKINKYSNGSSTASEAYVFSSYDLPAKASIVVVNIADQTKWADYNLGIPTHAIYGANNINNNGDDVYELATAADATIDIYGVVGIVGSGKDWEYQDSYAYRKSSILVPNTSFSSLEWTIASPNTLDGQGSDLSSFLTPGTHTFSTVIGSLELTSPNGGESYNAGQQVQFAWNSTDVSNVYFEVWADDMVWVQITENVASIDGANTHDFDIPGNAWTWDGYKIRVVDVDNASVSDESDAAFSIDGHDTELLWEDFEGSQFNTTFQYSVIGVKTWTAKDGYGEMNGYDKDNQENEEDWLITNAINLDNTTDELLAFQTSLNYPKDGSDLTVHYSTDYSGSGDPSGSTWTPLTATMATSSAYTHSGYIDLSSISGTIYIGFKYIGTTTEADLWKIKEIEVSGVDSTPTNIPTAKTQTKVSPNPFINELRIESAGDIKVARLFNTAGQVVKNVPASNGRIETGDVPAGMYILQIEFVDGSSTTQKVIKKQ